MSSRPARLTNLFLPIGLVLFSFADFATRSGSAADPTQPQPSAEKPNVVIVLADDMGWGDPSCYNENSKCSTPHIDQLAAAGMRFTDAHAAGAWCTPSRYGLITGRYAFRTSLAWQKQPVIAEDVTTVAETLRRAGYATAMVGKWHLGFVDGQQADLSQPLLGGPCDRGFDSFFGLPASLDIPDYFWIHDRNVPKPPTVPIEDGNADTSRWSPVQGKFWRGGLRGEDFVLEDVLDRIGAEATARIESLAESDQPFFLYVPLTSPHTPWFPGEEFAAADGAGLYSQFVAHTDAILGRIVAQLETSGELDNTVVVFASDNGPVWYDVDVQRFGHNSTGGLRGMKGDVWEAGHRVPFIVRWSARIPAGSVSDQLIGFVDLHATLAQWAGTETPESAVDSLSFAGVCLGDPDAVVRKHLITYQDPVAIREGRWKLVTKPGSLGFLSHRYEDRSAFLQSDELNPSGSADTENLSGQLYDLQSDLGETDNLYGEMPELVKRLSERLETAKK